MTEQRLPRPAAAALAAVAAAAALAGCETVPKPLALDRPPPAPAVRSADFARLGNLSAEVDASGFPEAFVVTKPSLSGLTQAVGTVPARKIAEAVLSDAVSACFRAPVPGETAAARIEASMRSASMEVAGSVASARIAADFRITDRDGRTVFSARTEASKRSRWKRGIVPECALDAAASLAGDFLDALLRDSAALDALERLSAGTDAGPGGEGVRRPELTSFSLGDGGGGKVYGKCSVACNGWEETQTVEWIKRKIAPRCAEKLGADEDRVRVVYESEDFDPATRTWTLSFSASAGLPLAIVRYDSVTREGLCVADLKLLGADVEEASRRAREYVQQEMDRRAGMISGDGAGPTAGFRFGDIKTDVVRGTMELPFRLVR